MDTKIAFGRALRQIRKARGLTQEDFSDISSRTFLSTLERGIKYPTLEKIEDLSVKLDVHPLTLMAKLYMEKEETNFKDLMESVENELAEFDN